MIVTEKYLSTLKGFETAFEIFENPDIYELQEIVKANKEDDGNEFAWNNPSIPLVRAIVLDDGRVFAWNDNMATHDFVIRKLNLLRDNQKLIPIYIYLSKDLKKVTTISVVVWTMTKLYGNLTTNIKEKFISSLENNQYLQNLGLPEIRFEGKTYNKSILDEISKYI